MNEFLYLILQIFIVCLIQIIFEAFIDAGKKPYQAMIINVACFLGSLYILLDFIFNNILKNMNSMIQLPF